MTKKNANNNVLTVFTMPNCPNCPKVKEKCEEISKELGLEFKIVNIKEDPLEGLMYQVMETPSIALNDETLFFAENPSRAEIKKAIKMNLK